MSLPAAFLDDLRARAGLNAVVGRRVKLARAGREMKGCCPFHNEKTPSFYVNEEKGFYHCFGCGAHGDAIGFLMAADGLSFMEAVKLLADEAGLAMPEMERRTPEAEKRAGLHDFVAAAAGWYEAQLQKAGAADARDYLARRGVTDALVARFGLGFAPDSRDALSKMLAERFPDAPPAMAVEAGLVGQSDDEGGRRFDRFRGRLMFPIHDRRGRVLAFGGRILGAGEPKYLNSPEGPLFDKGRLLFNWHRAAPAARKSGRLVVVEGYMDVIGLAAVGLAEAVAPLGTAMTPEQIILAWSLVPEPVLAFDGDAAGGRAAVRAANRALPLLVPGKSLSLLTLPPGQDPDDVARSGGAGAVEALIARAVPLGRFLFEAEAASAPLDTPERRAAFRARLKVLAGEISNDGIRRDYLATWRGMADALLQPARTGGGRREGGREAGRWSKTDWAGPAALPPLMPETRAQADRLTEQGVAMVLAALCVRPDAVERHAEALAVLPIRSPALMALRDRLLGGRQPDSRLVDAALLANPEMDDGEFDRRIGLALASMTELHHIASEMQQPPDCSTDDGFRLEYERQQLLGAARDEARRRLASIATDDRDDR